MQKEDPKYIKMQPTFQRHVNFLYSLRSFLVLNDKRKINTEKSLKRKEWKTNRYFQSNFNKTTIFFGSALRKRPVSEDINSSILIFFTSFFHIFHESETDNEVRKKSQNSPLQNSPIFKKNIIETTNTNHINESRTPKRFQMFLWQKEKDKIFPNTKMERKKINFTNIKVFNPIKSNTISFCEYLHARGEYKRNSGKNQKAKNDGYVFNMC